MWHVKKFANNQTYFDYLHSDEVWLPRIAYILNSHTENINASTGRDANEGDNDWSNTADTTRELRYGGDNKRWLDTISLGTHFIELANNTLYFNDIEEPGVGWYRAEVVDGTLNITTPNGKATYDDVTGDLNFYNYPNDVYSIGGVV
jgi:hypothetical protein